MTTSSIEAVFSKIPELTPHGVGVYEAIPRYISHERRTELLKVAQDKLIQDVAGFNAACAWLQTRERIKTVNRNHTTYHLKHFMERDNFGYVSQGIFIAAAVHLGFVFKLTDENHGVYLNISEKALAPA